MIRIINQHGYEHKINEIIIKVDRGTVLGCPYTLENHYDDSERERVVQLYKDYFYKRVNDKHDLEFQEELLILKKMNEKYDIALACWCYPKICHAEVIKEYLEHNK